MEYLEIALQWVFGGLIIGCCGLLVFAVIADLTGWWDKPKGE